MVLLETYLLNAMVCRNISVTICAIQRWGTAREPKVASQLLTFVLTYNVVTSGNSVIEKAVFAGTKGGKKKEISFILTNICTNWHIPASIYSILVRIHTVQHWSATRKPEVCFALSDICANQQHSNQSKLSQANSSFGWDKKN